jgi:ketosteroid isomerase-like protein
MQQREGIDVEGDLCSLAERYAAGADSGDVEVFLSAFAEDAVLEVWRPDAGDEPSSRREGHAVLAEVPPALDRYVSTSHEVGECTYHLVDRARATGVVHCEAHHVSVATDAAGEPVGAHDDVMHIRYLDDYRRSDDGGWRIVQRRVMIDRIDRTPVDPHTVRATRGRP